MEAAERARTASDHYLASVLEHVIAECDGIVAFGRKNDPGNSSAPIPYVRSVTKTRGRFWLRPA
jgi:hypothetical protein